MGNCFARLWDDEAGFIISAELVLVATIVVIGLIVGLVMVRNQVVQELADVAQAIGSLSQTYCFPGIWVKHHCSQPVALTDGACFNDVKDYCQTGWWQCSGEWAAGITQTWMPIDSPPGGEQ
jgi:uncharacterized membrane protein YkgB